ncbi:MAG: formylglycine-generating enzyme family protein [Alphaproteobacteria bacterium]|nr:formylglycine-generating enzyme family protein [Alphaproteobacteria bacterium]
MNPFISLLTDLGFKKLFCLLKITIELKNIKKLFCLSLMMLILMSLLFLGCNKNDSSTAQRSDSLNLANLEANMLLIPGDTFTMGATNEQLTNNGDGFSVNFSPATQKITLGSYKICRFEVTQQLWLDVMGNHPSYFKDNLQSPVESVNWNDCQTFVTKLNQLTGKSYRLPTEAEWEYAARGGSNSTYRYIYSGTNISDSVAWHYGNGNGTTHPVGAKQANALTLFDMSGNVWEWCSDWYGVYSSVAVTNPMGPNTGTSKIVRGGSWYYDPRRGRVSYRDALNPSFRISFAGFRLASSSSN